HHHPRHRRQGGRRTTHRDRIAVTEDERGGVLLHHLAGLGRCISRSKRTRSTSRSRAGGTISLSAGAGGTLPPNHRLRKRPSTAEVYPSPSPARRAGPTQTRVGGLRPAVWWK